jgi:DNA-binding YbaB/EbfC family protein
MKLPKGFGGQGFSGMLQKAQAAMARAQTLNEELAMERVMIDRGPVKMVFDGLGELHGLKIDPAVVDPEDVEALEDLILSAVRSGFQEAVARREEKMKEIMPDMPDLGL